MKIPQEILLKLRELVWARADELGWVGLTDGMRSLHYASWAKDPAIEGILSRFLDAQSIRVYLKDTVMKPYCKEQQKDASPIFQALMIDPSSPIVSTFTKPHGCRLGDGRVLCWGAARDWKNVLIAVYERSRSGNGRPFAAVLLNGKHLAATGGLQDSVADVSRRLLIEKVLWL